VTRADRLGVADRLGDSDRTVPEDVAPPPALAIPGATGRVIGGGTASSGREQPGGVAGRLTADPRWTRAALGVLLVSTLVGYLWDLDRNGWGNSFYAAAVQSGTHSWTSFFYGSFDWGNYITVDKPPVSLWIMALSGRVFGFSSWSMLAPQALLGVASVALLYGAVRRVWGAPAGLIAGGLLALTPAAALMFRFNNPDAALTFLLVAAAYTLTRALERGSTGWLVGTGALIGAAFLAKSLQAGLVVPGMALAYLVSAPTRSLRRVGQLVAAGAVMLVSGLWWPLLVDAIPAGSRPYVGGSTANSVMQLILGFNGLGRITGQEGGPGGSPRGGGFSGAGGGSFSGPGGGGFSGAGGGSFSGATGWDRLFNTEFAGFIAWWLPVAVIGLLAGVWLVRRGRHVPARRTDPRVGSLLLWAGWTLVTAAVLSFANGIIHTYYAVALAPGVAALAGMTLPALWARRAELAARIFLAAAAAAASVTSFVILRRTPEWFPWLAWAVLAAGLGAAGALLTLRPAGCQEESAEPPGGLAGARSASTPSRRVPLSRRIGAIAGAVALAAGVAGPLAWSLATIGTTHTGSIPIAGPAQVARQSFARMPGGFRGDAGRGPDGRGGPDGDLPQGSLPPGVFPQAGQGRQGPNPFGGGRPGGPPGGPGEAANVSQELTTLLRNGTSGYRWVAAASGSMTAGPLQLAVDAPVMSLGGFNGRDHAITLDRFKALVAAHQVHYFVGGGSDGMPGARGTDSSVASWVSSAFSSTTVGSTVVYDLSRPLASS
jgi:4-amino-4-deoxy-L-arabinose transferase-like glycosyltransferase